MVAITKSKKIVWKDGKIVDRKNAWVDILTHTLHYGTGVFEGIRAYKTERGTAIFRLREHVDRFFNSIKILSLPKPPFSKDEIVEAIIEVVNTSKLEECYIRPIYYLGSETIGLNVDNLSPHIAIIAISFPSYLGEKAKEKGVRTKIEGIRIPSHIIPQNAKATANYLHSSIVSKKVRSLGYDEAVMLNIHGRIAEGPGENVFMVKDNALFTPSKEEDILEGITRDSVIKIAKELGIEVKEKPISVGEFLSSQEAFFTGTAAEITPIIEIDNVRLSKRPGKITKEIQKQFFRAVKEREEWITTIK